jgi:macrolide transport system ATP-binding/permease protein
MIQAKNITFSYSAVSEPILRGVSLQIERGEMVAITGPSGSGKSTLFYILGGLLSPTDGRLSIAGQDIYGMSNERLASFRNHNIGFVFQHFHLLPRAPVLENILLPSVYSKKLHKSLTTSAKDLASRLGLGERLDHRPDQLSGGQQQRVAVARALLFDPDILLCDEPTGNLDTKNAREVITLLEELNGQGKTVVIITHDQKIAAACSRQIEIQDGRVVSDSRKDAARLRLHDVSENLPRSADEESGFFSWRQSARPGFDNIRRNKFKSLLTMVGVAIGTAALVAVMTLGEFAKTRILEGYESLGVNRIDGGVYRRFGSSSEAAANLFRGLTWEGDLKPLTSVFPQIRYLTPISNFYLDKISFGGQSKSLDNSRVVGVNEQYLPMSGFAVADGRSLSAIDVKEQRRSCVVGARVAKILLPKPDMTLVGQTIGIMNSDKSVLCNVVGVLAPIRSNQEWNNPDTTIYAPVDFVQSISWNSYVHGFAVAAKKVEDVEPLTIALKNYFLHKYGQGVEVWINNDSKLLAQMNRFLGLFSVLLISVAGISLLVGGVGIYNMMAVSVSERLREIGLRKAIGAGDKAIRSMVLFESGLLCSLAGVAGVLIGVGGCGLVMYLVSQVMPKVQFEWLFNPFSILISMSLCVLTGVLSGLLPARKAEKMQIIQAMRVE